MYHQSDNIEDGLFHSWGAGLALSLEPPTLTDNPTLLSMGEVSRPGPVPNDLCQCVMPTLPQALQYPCPLAFITCKLSQDCGVTCPRCPESERHSFLVPPHSSY